MFVIVEEQPLVMERHRKMMRVKDSLDMLQLEKITNYDNQGVMKVYVTTPRKVKEMKKELKMLDLAEILDSFTPKESKEMTVFKNLQKSEKIGLYSSSFVNSNVRYINNPKPKSLNRYRVKFKNKNPNQTSKGQINVKRSMVDINTKDSSQVKNINKRSFLSLNSSNYNSSVKSIQKDDAPQKLPAIHTNFDRKMFENENLRSHNTSMNLVMNDPLNRNDGEVFKKRSIRINNRVKVSLYSPKGVNIPLIPSRLISKFGTDNRYSSVDNAKERDLKLNQKINKSNAETSITRFSGVQNNQKGREWSINDRPDELLKRYLRNKRKEVQLMATSRQGLNSTRKSIHSGCQDLTSQHLAVPELNSKTNLESKSNSSKEYITNLKEKVSLITKKMPKPKKPLITRLLRRTSVVRQIDSDSDSYLEYDGMKLKELEDVKKTINFDLTKLKNKYE